jgi:hypothetical protein
LGVMRVMAGAEQEGHALQRAKVHVGTTAHVRCVGVHLHPSNQPPNASSGKSVSAAG